MRKALLFAVAAVVVVSMASSVHAYSNAWGWGTIGAPTWNSTDVTMKTPPGMNTVHDANTTAYPTPYFTPTSAYAGPGTSVAYQPYSSFGYSYQHMGAAGPIPMYTVSGNSYTVHNPPWTAPTSPPFTVTESFNQTSAFLGGWMLFQSSSSDEFEFSMGYSYSLNLETHAQGFADGVISLSMSVMEWDPIQVRWVETGFGSDVFVSELIDNGGAPFYTAGQGVLTTLFAPEAGVTYGLDFNAYAYFSSQATPIPGAVWLLGSGLVGLAGLRRRFCQ